MLGESAVSDRVRALRMLVVDDHPANRVLTQQQLQPLGYEIDLCEDGHHALQRFAKAHYDVVMTDLNMPGMDGCSLAQNLRSQGATLPIIAITATAGAAEQEHCAAAGIDAVLVRPVLPDVIDRTVRQLMGAATAPESPASSFADLTCGPLPAKIHALMQQALQQSMEAIGTALDKDDLQTVRDHLHALRGSFAMIHEMETADIAAHLEKLIAADDQSALKTAMREFAEHASSALERRAATLGDMT